MNPAKNNRLLVARLFLRKKRLNQLILASFLMDINNL